MSLSGALGAAEFSLSTKGNDFYDLSNVDGYNVGMKIEPYNFEMAAGGPATLGTVRNVSRKWSGTVPYAPRGNATKFLEQFNSFITCGFEHMCVDK